MAMPSMLHDHRPCAVVRGTPVITERRVRANGFRSRSLSVDGGGPPMLMLHGFSDTADTWRPVMRELAARGQQATAVDMPGYGRADRTRPGAMLPQIEGFVAELLERSGPDTILVGNSLGALASLRTAAAVTSELGGVVAISPAGFGHSRLIRYAEHAGLATNLLRVPFVPNRLMEAMVGKAFARMACGNHALADAEAVKAYAEQFRQRADVRRILGAGPAIIREIKAAADTLTLDCPVLAIWGSRDRLTLVGGSEELMDTLPDSELVVLPGFGHCPQLEVPDGVAELLLNFSSRTAAAPAR
ncbi:alpha/beta hydrolase [Rhodococcus sp. X156]|uniref:alpha/beta fold hydrolase n=1 Tax=Rhodococcus sp. X156 TaxID=2499145 RepID=UPI000FD9AE56|nr:alpha/beta hydrolase [Rhodococcus sp. X156]